MNKTLLIASAVVSVVLTVALIVVLVVVLNDSSSSETTNVSVRTITTSALSRKRLASNIGQVRCMNHATTATVLLFYLDLIL